MKCNILPLKLSDLNELVMSFFIPTHMHVNAYTMTHWVKWHSNKEDANNNKAKKKKRYRKLMKLIKN